MRLLKASTIELEEFPPDRIPPYAILSHTWGENEVLFNDFQRGTAESKASWSKVQATCQRTVEDGREYVWVDHCCIDKSSSAELSETINSMYSWYEKAEICYAYLADVPTEVDPYEPGSAFDRSRWFTRGFTLQELLAPSEVIFFSKEWVEIGRKSTLCSALTRITNIDEDILLHRKPLEWASVAARMSWAAHRQTTRPEDVAYCLMGIFSVNMPMLYGEGSKAFLRLQEEIMKQSDDQSLFAWVDRNASPDSLRGLLATSPSNFANCHNIFPYQDWKPRLPYSMTNRGLQIELSLTQSKRDKTIYIAIIDCPSPPEYKRSLTILLKRLSQVDEQYARIRAGTLTSADEGVDIDDLRTPKRTIYVRQRIPNPESEGVFPNHYLQLRPFPSISHHRMTKVVFEKPTASNNATMRSLPSGASSKTEYTSIDNPTQGEFREWFAMEKTKNHLSAFITFAPSGDRPGLLLLLGTKGPFDAGFDASEMWGGEFSKDDFDTMRQGYKPKAPGTWITLEYHRIYVNAQPRVKYSAKCFMIDIEIEDVVDKSKEARVVAEELKTANSSVRRDEDSELNDNDDDGSKAEGSRFGRLRAIKREFKLRAGSSRDERSF